MPERPETDPQPLPPTLEDLAAEFLARQGEEGAPTLEECAARLPDEAQRAHLRELVSDVESAQRSLPKLPTPGTLFRGRYQIVRPIGEGGMGRVYLAKDRELGREVAIKIMSSIGRDEADRQMLLLKESRLLAVLKHPNIVAVHDSGLEGELAYLVMDFVDGLALDDVLQRMRSEVQRSGSGRIASRDGSLWLRALDKPIPHGRPSLIDARDWYVTSARIACEIARTIEAAHGQGVFHRDLKPSNVMLLGGAQPVVLDFGLAGSEQVKLGDITQGLYGSVPYLAPEQVKSERVGLDARTDIYQLGLILYELLTLQRAFTGPLMADVLERVKNGWFERPSKLNPGVPRALEAICMLALELEPSRRYPTAAALRADLESYLSGTSVPVALKNDRTRALARSLRAASKRHPVLTGLAAVALVTLVGWRIALASRPREMAAFESFCAFVDSTGTLKLRSIDSGGAVRPGDKLGVVVRSNKKLVLYVLSVFSTGQGEPLATPMRLVLLDDTTNGGTSAGTYGLEVEACSGPNGEECPRVFCSRVEKDNRVEGLLVLGCDQEYNEIENWMNDLVLRAVPATLDEAVSTFPTKAIPTRGGPVVDDKTFQEQRRQLFEAMHNEGLVQRFKGLTTLYATYNVSQP